MVWTMMFHFSYYAAYTYAYSKPSGLFGVLR